MSETSEFETMSIEQLGRILVENKEEIGMRTKDNKIIKKVLDKKVFETKKIAPSAPIYVPPISGIIEPEKKYEVKIVAAPRPPIKIPDVPRTPLPGLEEILTDYLREKGGHFGTPKEFIAWHDKFLETRKKAIEEEYNLARDRAIQEAQLRAAQEPEPETVYKTSIVPMKVPKEKKRKAPTVVFEGEKKAKKVKRSVSSSSSVDDGENQDNDEEFSETTTDPVNLSEGVSFF